MSDTELNTQREAIRQSLEKANVPKHLHLGIIRYVVDGIRPSSFVYHVFSNNLTKAVCAADDDMTIEQLRALARWIYNDAAYECHGSRALMEQWIEIKDEEREGKR